jgi:hypothetical protein
MASRTEFNMGMIAAFLAVLGTGGQPAETGFTPLFNGKDLAGWVVENDAKFAVKDGVLWLDGDKGWLRLAKEHQDFELRLDFRFVTRGADSGVFFRADREGKNWPVRHYQVQTMDNESIAALFGAGLARPKSTRDADAMRKVRRTDGGWQSYAILVQGDRIEVRLNDALITSASGLTVRPGHIGLQSESGQVAFKNLRIRVMK